MSISANSFKIQDRQIKRLNIQYQITSEAVPRVQGHDDSISLHGRNYMFANVCNAMTEVQLLNLFFSGLLPWSCIALKPRGRINALQMLDSICAGAYRSYEANQRWNDVKYSDRIVTSCHLYIPSLEHAFPCFLEFQMNRNKHASRKAERQNQTHIDIGFYLDIDMYILIFTHTHIQM